MHKWIKCITWPQPLLSQLMVSVKFKWHNAYKLQGCKQFSADHMTSSQWDSRARYSCVILNLCWLRGSITPSRFAHKSLPQWATLWRAITGSIALLPRSSRQQHGDAWLLGVIWQPSVLCIIWKEWWNSFCIQTFGVCFLMSIFLASRTNFLIQCAQSSASISSSAADITHTQQTLLQLEVHTAKRQPTHCRYLIAVWVAESTVLPSV